MKPTHSCLFIPHAVVKIGAIKGEAFESGIRHNQTFNSVTKNSITIAELTDLFSEAARAIMPFWTKSFELATLNIQLNTLNMLYNVVKRLSNDVNQG